MSKSVDRDPFFVGFINAIPGPIALISAVAAGLFLAVMATFAFSLSSSVDDPGDGRFVWGEGRQELAGILELHPYPLLRLPSDGEQSARTILMSGQGKRGVQARAAPLEGQMVEAGGIFLRRGTITMLQVGGRPGLQAPTADHPSFRPVERVKLGKWLLAGEICDGKCYTGAMRPGRGLAHKACANLCIFGGVPPVFVTEKPVDGATFFLLAGPDGKALPEKLLRYTAQFVELEGYIERSDDLHILRVDPDSLRPL